MLLIDSAALQAGSSPLLQNSAQKQSPRITTRIKTIRSLIGGTTGVVAVIRVSCRRQLRSPAPVTTAAAMGSSQSAQAAGNVATSINGFGDSMFGQLQAAAKPEADIFLSPFGIARALGMLLNAVEPGGESYRQLQQVVFGSAAAAAADGGALDALNSQLLQLSMALTQESSATLSVSDANSVWVAQRYQLQAAYADALKASFGAAAAPITSAAAINAWVEGATGGKIRELVDESAVRQATIILINAIYFKGDWLHPFKKAATVPRDFFPLLHSSTTVQAATMSQTYKPVSKIRTALLPAVTNGGTKLTCPAVCLPYKAANSPNSGSPAVRARGRQEREQPGEFYGVVANAGRRAEHYSSG